MVKEGKVSLPQTGLSDEEKILRAEAMVQPQHSLPRAPAPALPSQSAGLWLPGSGPLYRSWRRLPITAWAVPAPLPGGVPTRGPEVRLWLSSKASLWGGECHGLPSLWWLLLSSSPSKLSWLY